MADEEGVDRTAKYQFAAVVSKGLIYTKVTFLDEIEVMVKWPYALHAEVRNLAAHADELLEGGRVHYETCLGALDIDKDLQALFGEDEEPSGPEDSDV